MTGGPIILAAGGTGGHIFPAQALAEALTERGRTLALITDDRGGAYAGTLGGIPTYRVGASNLSGGIVSKLGGLSVLGLGTLRAAWLLRRLRPSAVVGFGGYPSVPTMLAATQLGIPTMIHEQNAVMGRANVILAPRVRRIATSYPEVTGLREADAGKVALTGNPVRAAIAALSTRPYDAPVPDGELAVLVIGGSQGARVFSDVVPAAVVRLPERSRGRLRITQQCRPEDVVRVGEAYRECGVEAELSTFFEDIPARLARAHLVISRAGASSVAEVTAAGRPAVYVPLPSALDDHQTANARAVEDARGGWLMPERCFRPEVLSLRLEALLNLPATLEQASRAARTVGRPDAARLLADLVDRLAGYDGNGAETRERAA